MVLGWIWLASAAAAARWRLVPLLACALVALSAAESVRVSPSFLSYFNPVAARADGGRGVALDSNLDWGQDLLRLKRWLDENKVSGPVQLLYWGRVDPAIYGIDYRVPVGRPLEPGLLAVSAGYSALRFTLDDHGHLLPESGPFRLDPAVVGAPIADLGSIRVYEVGRPRSSLQLRP
jgi:hypothetical protein